MNKKIFISYAWGDEENQRWVMDLGKRLMNDTVDVVLDKWSLKEGHDIHEFMETMVKAEDIFRVLIISDKNYTNKANSRDGGVGTETQIITPAIYGDQKQEKFIPVVVGKDDNGKPYLPVYLASRKYIDFSNEEYFESSYEELLRNILEKPAEPKPKLGTTVPLYITESHTNNSETSSMVRVLDNQLKKNPDKVNSYVSDFLEKFLENMWDFELKITSNDLSTIGEELIENLLSFKVLRDDFIDCLLIATKEEFTVDVDILVDFFAKATTFTRPRENSGSWRSSDYDNFKIIFEELFIYTVAVCLKNKNYSLVGDLLHSKYYVFDSHRGATIPKRFTFLYKYHDNLEDYYSNYQSKITGFGHYVITNLNSKISKEDFILADTLCHYIGDLYKEGDFTDNWFPTTHLYKSEYSNFEFFDKLTSQRFFDKVKFIFEVQTKEEFKSLLNEYKNKKDGIQHFRYGRGAFNDIPFIYEIIDVDNIGKHK